MYYLQYSYSFYDQGNNANDRSFFYTISEITVEFGQFKPPRKLEKHKQSVKIITLH